jgi:hypothetical protein
VYEALERYSFYLGVERVKADDLRRVIGETIDSIRSPESTTEQAALT